MESKESTTRAAGALIHPQAAEWMEFLYGEISQQSRNELQAHLGECAQCAEQVAKWREGMEALDEFQLPSTPRSRRRWLPVLRLAAAAAIVIAAGMGFTIGRRASSSAEIESLKNSVAQLELMAQGQQTLNYSNTLFAATAAANQETLRLLSDFARVQDEKQLADQRAFAVALQNFEARLQKVHRDLETVAINTQTGFQQTHQNLSELVSYFPPAQIPNSK